MDEDITIIEEAGNVTITNDSDVSIVLYPTDSSVNITNADGSVTVTSQESPITVSTEQSSINISTEETPITITGGGSPTTFRLLTDTPNDYTADALKVLRVNADETGIEFVEADFGGGAWGEITGTLSDQTDLQSALDLKYDSADFNTDFDTRLATKDTDDIAEGSNLYYTQARVSANTDVAANTLARHDAVTVTDSSEIDFTLTGQDITASLIAGSIDETKLDTSVNASLDLADSSIQPLDNISELTNDSGFITASSTDTLTNKTIDGDSNTLSNLDIGNEVNWASASDVTDRTAFASGDKLLIFEDSVGLRKIDYDDLPSGGGSSPLTTKGDLYTYSTTDARLPVGTNGQVLSADSTEPTGLKWATAPSGSPAGADRYIQYNNSGVFGGTSKIREGNVYLDPATIPSGSGSRILFSTVNNAFRAGYASGDYWDAANLGASSFAAGSLTKVSGSSSATLGSQNIVDADESVALGVRNTISSSANISVVLGRLNISNGNVSNIIGLTNELSSDFSNIIGTNNNITNLDYSLIFGHKNEISLATPVNYHNIIGNDNDIDTSNFEATNIYTTQIGSFGKPHIINSITETYNHFNIGEFSFKPDYGAVQVVKTNYANDTSDSTAVNLGINIKDTRPTFGSGVYNDFSGSYRIPENKTVLINLDVVAVSHGDMDIATWEYKIIAQNNGTTTEIVKIIDTTDNTEKTAGTYLTGNLLDESLAVWSISIDVDSNSFVISAKGEDGVDIRWSANIKSQELYVPSQPGYS